MPNFLNTLYYICHISIALAEDLFGVLNQGGPTSALLWATFQNYSSLRASAG